MIVALGDLMLDIVMRLSEPLSQGGHALAQAHLSPGGSAANFAVWACRLGAEVGLIARVGNDLLGHALLQDLKQEGITQGLLVGEETTGFTVALDQGGTRTMLAARGAASALRVDDLDLSLLEQADILHITAYSFFDDSPRQATLAAMRFVQERGKLVSLDPAAYGFLKNAGPERFLALAKGVDMLFPNLDEGRALTGEEEPERVLHVLLRHFPVVALKLGEYGAMAGAGEAVVHHPGFSVPVVDTMGAGDAFAAGFVVHWLAHHDLAQAVEQGNRVAAGVVQVSGARYAQYGHVFRAGPLAL